jgi:hypothetical protein
LDKINPDDELTNKSQDLLDNINPDEELKIILGTIRARLIPMIC